MKIATEAMVSMAMPNNSVAQPRRFPGLVDARRRGDARQQPWRAGDAGERRQRHDDEGDGADAAEGVGIALGDGGQALARHVEGERGRKNDGQALSRLGAADAAQDRPGRELRARADW